MAERIRQFGIIPEFSFVIGNPRDPERDTRETLEFIRKIKRINPDSEIIIYHYTPVPQRTACTANIDGQIDVSHDAGRMGDEALDGLHAAHRSQHAVAEAQDKELIDNFEVVICSLAHGAGHSRAALEPHAAEDAERVAICGEDLRVSEGIAVGTPVHRSAQAKAGEPVAA